MPSFNDDFSIIKKIGEGTNAKIYLAEEKKTKKTVVIKHYEQIKSPKKFTNEIKALKINNEYPNSIKYYQHGSHIGGKYIVFENNKSESVISYLDRGKRFSLSQSLQMAKDLLEIIAFNNKRNVLHLDLMPSNIVYNGKSFYLIDFGNAKFGQTVKNHDVKFNSLYIAPEVYTGTRSLQSEIYSIGCILYYMVTQGNINQMYGLTTRSTKAEKIYAHIYKEPCFSRDIPTNIKNLLELMLHKDPPKRPKINTLLDIIEKINNEPDISSEKQTSTFDIYQTMANDNIAYGLFKMGYFYEKGHYVDKDIIKAQSFYEKAVEKGDIEAYYHLGLLLQDSDEQRAIELLQHCEQHSTTVNLSDLFNLKLDRLNQQYKKVKATNNINSQKHILKNIIQISNDTKYYNMLGILYKKNNQIKESIAILEQGLIIEPSKRSILCNLSDIYTSKYDFFNANRIIKQLLDFYPNQAISHLKSAIMHHEMHQFEQAKKSYLKAIELRPNDPKIKNRLGQMLILNGDFESGFKYREARLELPKHSYLDEKITKENLYTGQDLKNKTILVYREQGLGDTIQYLRYLPYLKDMGAKIIFRGNPPLKELIKDLPYIDIFLSDSKAIQQVDFDYHISLLSLPSFFSYSKESIPVNFPYMYTPENIQPSIDIDPEKLNIGIAWEGGLKSENNRKRNVDISYFSNLFDIKNTQIYSLQLARQNKAIYEKGYNEKILDISSKLNSMLDTAVIINQLDLVISVDTSIAHLSGALNHPTWMPIQYTPDYRWGIKGKNSYWYPSIRLFRETQRKDDGNWDDCFQQIKKELTLLASRKF